MENKKIAVLLSGGVDSSVALYLALQKYQNVKCFYLKIWLEDELSYLGSCPWEEDLQYVKSVCEKFNVEYEVVNLQNEYFEYVVNYVIEDLKEGNTPSPDIFCNQRIKFGAFLDKVHENFDLIVTGHYAKIVFEENKYLLKQAKDKVKDQTYFLSHLSKDIIAKLYFPLGDYLKQEVRELAQKIDLPNKARKDSQGICFLGKIKYDDFVKHYLGEKQGQIIELETGKVLGTHQGFWFFTIGQRKGIHLGNGPWFVVKKDTENNIVYISHEENHLKKAKSTFKVGNINWIHEKANQNSEIFIKIRHGKEISKAQIEYLENDLIKITLEEPDNGIAQGQFAIFYENEICLGGAKIKEVLG